MTLRVLGSVCALLWMCPEVLASDVSLKQHRPGSGSDHSVLDLRVGVQAIAHEEGQAHPYVCGEVSPMKRVSIEACGNGSGILHRAEGSDMAHFRLRGSLATFLRGSSSASLVVGAGFMEVQRTADRPGFDFGSSEAGAVEAAGPEASVGIRARRWISDRSCFTADAVVGSAYVEGAPLVMGWTSPVVPFASLTVGVGF